MKKSPSQKTLRSDSAWYIFTGLFFIILVTVAGYGFIEQQKQFLIDDKQKEIATIADLKSARLTEWRKGQIATGMAIKTNSMIAGRIRTAIAGKGSEKAGANREVRSWLASLVQLGEYNKSTLFSPDGHVIAAVSDSKEPLPRHYRDLAAAGVTGLAVQLSDFHKDTPESPFDINLVVPIMYSDGIRSNCIAVLILDIDPEKRIYPLIKSWPTASESAETLLVRREGNSVLFLNDLRFSKNLPRPFLLPLTNPNIPAVKAVLGYEGSFIGVDYRNVAVLSAIKSVPGTKWSVVAKIDVDEVMAQLDKSIFMVAFVGIILIITLFLSMFLWGLRRKSESLRKLFEVEQKYNAELKKSEAALTQSRDNHIKLLETFPSLTWRSGLDATCDYFNQTWLDFTGRTLEEEFGNGWTEGVHPDDLDRCMTTYLNAFNSRRPFVMEYRLRYHDGSYHWINDHGCPYFSASGDFAGYIGSCFDINAQKNAELELQGIHSNLERQILERTRDLSEINELLRLEISEREQLEHQLLNAKRLEAIGQIAGGVAHEVRNPLNAILTITEALFREEEIAANPELEPYMEHIRTQVNRLVRLMNELLDLGRTIPATNLQPISLYEICRDTLALWESTGTSRNRVILEAPDTKTSSLQIVADGLKLQQVFFNLLENAGFHSLDGNCIIIRIPESNFDPSAPMAVVQIIDQGTGIAEDKLPLIFEPFYTDRKGGTGLGLALVKHFIENMNGTVQIWNNSPQPGCTAEVRIPIYHEELK